MKLRIKTTKFTVKAIGWIQIIGGVYGLGLMAYLMLNTGEINGALLLIFLLGLTFFSFSIYSGKQLITKHTLKVGIVLSIINQVFQIVQFKIAGFGLSYSSGTELLIGFSDSIKFNFAIISSSFKMSFNQDSSEIELMINIMAVLILIVLVDIWEEIKNEGQDELKIEDGQETDVEHTLANNS